MKHFDRCDTAEIYRWKRMEVKPTYVFLAHKKAVCVDVDGGGETMCFWRLVSVSSLCMGWAEVCT